MTIDAIKPYVSIAAWRQEGGDSLCASVNALKHPGPVRFCYFLERCPIVGCLVSIPAMLAFGALSTYYFAKSFFGKDDVQKAFANGHANAYALLCLNQLLNICTGGILNNIFAHTLSQKN